VDSRVKNFLYYSYSVSCGLSAAPAPVGTGDCRHQPAPTGKSTAPTGPGLFYDVFDTHFVLNSQKRYDILKILIKYVIKQTGPVRCRSCAGSVRSRPVCADRCRSRLVPVGTGAADRPQETL
jgi:hypothetical protein